MLQSFSEETCRTTIRVATGRTYDVYNVQPQRHVRTAKAAPPPPAPVTILTPLPVPSPLKRRPPGLRHVASFATQTVVNAVVEAVSESRDRPELTEDGTGGVYLIRKPSAEAEGGSGPSSPVAVFKPTDEEAGSDNNPRGLRGEAHMMREGFRPGGGATREVVAYKLDRGFAGVPKTAVDKLMLRTRTGTRLCEQTGSIQQFVESQGDASEYRFDGSDFCDAACQRLALQDLRLFNCDRHEGNILVRTAPTDEWVDEKLELVPIDHAFILPSFGYFREAELAWRYWLAAATPFGREAIEYVAGLNVDADVEVARQAGLDESSCATLRTCTMLLRAALLGEGRRPVAAKEGEEAGAAIGITPKALAGMLMRESVDEPSPLECLCAKALGVADEDLGKDSALIDFVVAERPEGAADYVPPPEFYARLEELLEERFSPPRACDAGQA